MDENTNIEILRQNDLKITPLRLSILDSFHTNDIALTAKEIRKKIDESDRVSVYRNLKTFLGKGILHEVIDSEGIVRYAVSKNNQNQEHDHVHFKCNNCNNTYCLEKECLQEYSLPAGFKGEKIHILIEGLCKRCN